MFILEQILPTVCLLDLPPTCRKKKNNDDVTDIATNYPKYTGGDVLSSIRPRLYFLIRPRRCTDVHPSKQTLTRLHAPPLADEAEAEVQPENLAWQ